MNEYKIIKLNTARNALRYIIKAFEIKEIYIPYYICPAVRIAVSKENCNMKFYHIDINFNPVYNFPENAFILYPDYFGVCGNIIDKMVHKYKNLIIDNAHSFFATPKGIACFSSIRKFFPEICDGAFLYTKKVCGVTFFKDNYEYEYKKLSFKELCKNECRLDYEDIKYMSDCTKKYFSYLDLENEKLKYINNFKLNHIKYKNSNKLKLEIKKHDAPFKYPYLADKMDNADNFVKNLEKDGKIIFRYWHNLPDSYIEKEFYTKLIAL